MTQPKLERRTYQLEVRAIEGDKPKIGGYAARFNSPTVIGGYFREQIAPGAFAQAILDDDVRALINHDANLILGRNTSNTLRLAEDAQGLSWEADLPPTTYAQDLMVSVDRGDISGCSFAFMAEREEWDDTGDMPMRTLLQVRLSDVSAVTYPAYDDTSVAVRSLEAFRKTAAASGLITPGTLATARMRRAQLDRRIRG